jgi:hypothetical protein
VVQGAIRLRPCRGLRHYPPKSAMRLPNGVRGRFRRRHRMCTLVFRRQHRPKRGRSSREPRVATARSFQKRQNELRIRFLDSKGQEQQDRSPSRHILGTSPLSRQHTFLAPELGPPRATRGPFQLRKRIRPRPIIPFQTLSTVRRPNLRGKRKGTWPLLACLVKRLISGLSPQHRSAIESSIVPC